MEKTYKYMRYLNSFENFEHINESDVLQLSKVAKDVYTYIKANKYDVFLLIDNKKIGNPNATFSIQTTTKSMSGSNKILVTGVGQDLNGVKQTMTKLKETILGHFDFLKESGELKVIPNGMKPGVFNGEFTLLLK